MSFTFNIRERFLVALLLLAAFLVGSLWFFLDARLRDWKEASHRESLVRNTRLLQTALRQKTESLTEQAALVAERLTLDLPGHAGRPSPGILYDYARLCLDLTAKTPLPLFIVTDRTGRVLFDSYQLPENLLAIRQGRAVDLKACRSEASSPPLTAAPWPNIQEALKGSTVHGLFVYGMDFIPKTLTDQRLVFESITLPLAADPGDPPEGALVLGFPLDEVFAQGLQSLTDEPIIIEIGGRVLASTWGPSSARELAELLSGITGKADAAASSDAPPSPWPLRWKQKDYDLVLLPLFEPRGIRIGHCILMQERPPAASLQTALRRVLIVIAFVGCLLALALGWFLSRPITTALRDLKRTTDQARPGSQPPEVTPTSDEVSSLAGSIGRMVSRFSDQEKVRHILGKKVSPEVSRQILASGEDLTVKGERRKCSVLFALLSGLRPPEDDAPPERWIGDLNEALEVFSRVVLDHQGTVDRFGNGTLQAVWGAPVMVEDQDRRCLETAFEMRKQLEGLNRKRVSRGENPLFLSLGVHTGLMLAGYLGSEQNSDYTVLGEEADKAEALSHQARRDHILASESFYQSLSSRVVFRRLDPTPGRPETVYEAVDWVP